MACKLFSGRKRENSVWQYFKYDAVVNKSTCLVSIADDKKCGRFISGKNTTNLLNHIPATTTDVSSLPPLKEFKFLSQKLNRSTDVAVDSQANHKMEIGRYIAGYRMLSTEQDRLAFGQQRQQVYPRLAPVAMDLVSAPASEAYCERVFSVCGELCNGKMNRLSVNLERRVFMKLNMELLNVI